MVRSCFIVAALVTAVLALAGSPARAEDAWQNLTTKEGLPADEVQLLKKDVGGTLWVGTAKGLLRLADGKPEKPALGAEAWDVLRLSEKTMWVGTGNGAVMIEGATQTPSLQGRIVGAITELKPGVLLALAKDRRTELNALMVKAEKDWEPVAAGAGKNAQEMVKMKDGSVWVTLEGSGVLVFDPAKGVASPTKHHEGQSVTAIHQDASGAVWCGLWNRGVAGWDGKAWANHLQNKKFFTLAIRKDKAGVVWVATDQAGLFRYDGKAWTNDVADQGPISVLETTSDGRVWISTGQTGGLQVFDGKKWSVSLAGPRPMRGVVETDKHLVAAGVLDGLFVLPIKK